VVETTDLLPEPTRRLAPRARSLWRLEQVITWGIATVGGVVAAGSPFDGVLDALLVAVPVSGLVLASTFVPGIRWRRWRWDVHPDAIDIRRGTLVEHRTLIPMWRVQHVDITRDVFEQMLDLATVRVHTAAGSHKIPMLTMADAGELRDRIAELARAADEP
jgi:membrane protein YdbS with pleckstrin-like domain